MTLQHTEPELVATAYHESGHAIAISTAFRDAAWLPYPPPPVRVRSVEVSEDAPGQWRFAKLNCDTEADLKLAEGVLADLRRLRRYDEQNLVDRTLAVLLTHWPAVEGVAAALIEHRRVEGDQVERIINDCMIGSAS